MKDIRDISITGLKNTQRATAQTVLTIASNTVVHPLSEIFNTAFDMENLPAYAENRNDKNIMQCVFEKDSRGLFFFIRELAEYIKEIDALDYKKREDYVNRLTGQIMYETESVMEHLKSAPLIITADYFIEQSLAGKDIHALLQPAAEKLNKHLKSVKVRNIKVLNISDFTSAGSYDMRFYRVYNRLYTFSHLKEIAWRTVPLIRSAMGHTKKMLIMDCDNTLWKGILGESTAGEIIPRTDVQLMAKRLKEKGVLLGICSKNNENDVNSVLTEERMILRPDDIAASKINWKNKSENIAEIIREVNLGSDSVVFIDDSRFETEMIRSLIPDVVSLTLPDDEKKLPGFLENVEQLFYKENITREDLNRTELYKNEKKRNTFKAGFNDIDSYLRSLNIKIRPAVNDINAAERISQLTLKTNQFNLTGIRYSTEDVLSAMQNGSVISICVSDIFGDSGLCGVCILEMERDTAFIAALMLSCRVLGRGIEFSFMDYIISHLKAKGVKILNSSYIATSKNMQTADYYDKLGFITLKQSESGKDYQTEPDSYAFSGADYIKTGCD